MQINATQLGQSPARACRRGLRMQFVGTAATAMGLMALGGALHAEAPPVGTIIGNQAIATFSDGVTTRSVTSNLVQTEINQVYAVDIEAPQTKPASVDGLVTFPHTITNTGNGADAFQVSATGVSGTFDSITLYADADCDGVADSATVLTQTPSLAAGEQFCVVVEANVGASVPAGGAATFNIEARSAGSDGDFNTVAVGESDINLDTINVTAGPVLDLTKELVSYTDTDNSGSITPGDEVLFRLTYANSNPDTVAVDVSVVDALPAGLTYVTGTGVWSDSNTDLTDAADGSPDEQVNGSGEGISYSVTGNVITAVVDIDATGVTRQGYIEFAATIDSDASGTLYNFGTINGTSSNLVPVPIATQDAIALVLNDSASSSALYANRSTNDLADSTTPTGAYSAGGTPSSATDDGPVGDDIIAENDTVAEGSVVPFQVVLTNHSNTAERFNLTAALDGTILGGQVFPNGTTFTFYSTGGAPLLDVDGNGIPDILIPANTALAFEVRADLPLNYSTVGVSPTNAGEQPSALVTATSSSNATIDNSTVIRLAGGVQGASVDIQNNDSGTFVAIGNLLEDGTAPWITQDVAPGETAVFNLRVVNSSLAPDSYNLSFSDTNFAAGTLPADWTVVFRNAGGAIVTNTGLLAANISTDAQVPTPGSFADLTATVTVPSAAAPGDTDMYFRATSATNSSVSDTKRDAVSVDEVADLAISPDREGQLAAGGALVLTHTLSNVGNVTITEGALNFSPTFPNLIGTLYLDMNGDGILQLGGTTPDIVIDNINDITAAVVGAAGAGLAPGESVTVFHRVLASSSAVAGLSESATIAVATSLNTTTTGIVDANSLNNTVTDIVTVVAGDLEVLKEQALDLNCNGTVGPFTIGLQTADPGQCIVYRVTVENTGTANATNVTVIDTTPAFTTMMRNPAPIAAPGSVSTDPAEGATGDVISTHGTLAPGAQATLTFTVKVDE